MRLEKRLLFPLLLLIFALSGCGSRPAEAPDPAPNGYAAQHFSLEQYGSLIDTCIVEDRVYYIDKLTSRSTFETIFFADLASGENGQLEPFTQYIRDHFRAQQSAQHPRRIAAAGDGSLRVLATRYVSKTDISYDLLCLDSEGNLTQKIPLGVRNFRLGTQTHPEMACDRAGRTYLLSDAGVTLLDGQEERTVSGQFDRLVPLSDGMAVLSASEDGTVWAIRPIDGETGALGTGFSVNAAARLQEVRFCPGNGDYAFFCAADLSLYSYRLPAGKAPAQAVPVLNWLNCDVEGPSLKAVAPLESGGFSCVTDGQVLGAEVALLRPREAEEAPVRVLTLGCRSLPASLSQQILRFNRQNTGVRVEILDYGAAPSGFAAAADRMTIDILSGKMPDLICTADLEVQTFIDQGLLEDLWPYIDGDARLGGREALVTPVFDALSQDGKLYEITGDFYIGTAYALSELVGDTPGWTVEEFTRIYQNMEDCRSIRSPRFTNKQSALKDVIAYCAQDFIDRQSWTASFDSPEFVALLEYADLFPQKSPSASYEEQETWPCDRRQLMVNLWLWGSGLFNDWDVRTTFGDQPVTRIGYPGVAGNGSVFITRSTLSMYAGGEHKEDAWAFLRALLLPENQTFGDPWDNSSIFLPTSRQVYDALIRRAMEQPYERGYLVTYPDGHREDLPAWTRERADEFWAFLSGITVVERTEAAISAIITDEADRFFAGEQTAESAARAIQSRVNLYLGERK